jgi:hypothetical protein
MEKALLDRGKFGGISDDDMIDCIAGSEHFVGIKGFTGQNVDHIQIDTARSLLFAHKGDVIGIFQRKAFLGTGNISLLCGTMIAYDASIDDGPHTLPSGQRRILTDGHLSKLDLTISAEYQRCCKQYQDDVCLSAHVFIPSGDDCNTKLFDIELQHVDRIHDPVRDIVPLQHLWGVLLWYLFHH